jgi:hypothetical protein
VSSRKTTTIASLVFIGNSGRPDQFRVAGGYRLVAREDRRENQGWLIGLVNADPAPDDPSEYSG